MLTVCPRRGSDAVATDRVSPPASEDSIIESVSRRGIRIPESQSGQLYKRNYLWQIQQTRLYSQVDLTEQKFKTPSFKLHPSHFQNGPAGPHLKRLRPSPTVRDPVSLGDTIPGKREPISNWGISHSTACLS